MVAGLAAQTSQQAGGLKDTTEQLFHTLLVRVVVEHKLLPLLRNPLTGRAVVQVMLDKLAQLILAVIQDKMGPLLKKVHEAFGTVRN